MPKNNWHESFKSFLGSHIDPEKDEELRGTKAETEGKVQKILKLLQEEDGDGKESLVTFIKDFHNDYLSLYDSYDHLTEELRKKAYSKHDKDSSSSSSDSSDSDDSPRKKGKKNGKVEKHFESNTAGIKQDIEMALLEADDMRRKLNVTLDEKEALYLEYQNSLSRTEEAQSIIMDLRVEAERWNDEKSIILTENAGLSTELEAVKEQNFTLKEKLELVENDIAKINQIQKTSEEENSRLAAKNLLLEDEIQQAETKIQKLLSKSNQLSEKVAEKERELLNQVDQINKKQNELDSILSQKIESETQLMKKVQEISEFPSQMDNLKELLAKQKSELQKNDKERENLLLQVQRLELELNSTCKSKDDLGEQLSFLGAQKSELDIILEKNSGDISEFLVHIEKLKEELSSKSIDGERLIEEKESLTLQLEILQHQKSEMEEQISNKIDEGKQLKDENGRLKTMISDLEIKFQNCKENLKSSEKKMEEMAEQFQKDNDSKNLEINQLEENVEDLNRELEMKVDEISTLVENMRTTEVMQRLTSQKLRITEQLLNETEDSHVGKVVKLQKEKKILEERISNLSEIIATYKRNQVKMMAEVKKKVNEMLTGIDTLSMKFEEDYGHLDSRIFDIVNELEVTRNWIRETSAEKDQLKVEITNLVEQLTNEKEQGVLLRGKIQELETILEKDENERMFLTQTIKDREEKSGELEKIIGERNEKLGELECKMNEEEDRFLSLCEEKREAIRQLCVWIDYHQKRYEDLKDKFFKPRGVRRQIAT